MTVPDSLPNRPDGAPREDSLRDDALRAQLAGVLSANYELEQEIGRGGMGIVYRARDRRLKRPVAVKLLPPDLAYRPDIRSRFLREAETSAQLSHPNIVPIHTVEEADNLVFFIMGLVNGDTLARRMRDRGAMPADESRRILREVADALCYAHRRGVVHRDIKPDNILLDRDTGRAMVTDFGIARAVSEGTDARLTTTGLAIGTPAYMSPEQCAGDRSVDGRSDIYSLGVVGYQMLCGDLPFAAANTPAMFVKHLTEQPRPIMERVAVPTDLGDIVMRCLAKDPNDRFPSGQELVDALEGKASGAAPVRAAVAPVQQAAPIPIPGAPAPYLADLHAFEVSRWEAIPVREYRRKMVTWLAASAALVPLGIFGSHFWLFVDGMWGVSIAMGYAKLWNRGFDWRDVFRQPRDALFADVVNEKFEDVSAFFDANKRAQARERLRTRMRDGRPVGLSPVSVAPLPAASPYIPPVPMLQREPVGGPPSPAPIAAVTGFEPPVAREVASQLPVVQEAARTRADIHRLVASLPKNDREMLPDILGSADALYSRIEVLAATIGDLDRANVPGMGDAIEREVTELEAEANPLDEERSEWRVRRLAQLRRQRVSLRDLQKRRDEAAQKMNRCVSAMQSMRLDLNRLGTGATRSYESVTQIAEQAMQLGREVDAVLYAQDEIARALQRNG